PEFAPACSSTSAMLVDAYPFVANNCIAAMINRSRVLGAALTSFSFISDFDHRGLAVMVKDVRVPHERCGRCAPEVGHAWLCRHQLRIISDLVFEPVFPDAVRRKQHRLPELGFVRLQVRCKVTEPHLGTPR